MSLSSSHLDKGSPSSNPTRNNIPLLQIPEQIEQDQADEQEKGKKQGHHLGLSVAVGRKKKRQHTSRAISFLSLSPRSKATGGTFIATLARPAPAPPPPPPPFRNIKNVGKGRSSSRYIIVCEYSFFNTN